MNEPSNSRLVPGEASSWQFSVKSLLWLMVTSAMVMGYLRGGYREQLVPSLFVSTVLAAIAGLLVGLAFGKPADGLYWAVIGMLLAFLCAVSFWHRQLEMVLSWAWVGMVGGALAGAIPPRPRAMRFITCTVGGWVAMIAPLALGYLMEPSIDLPCTAAGGLILAILADIVTWLQRRYHTTRDVWAAGLVVAVIVGNLIAGQIMGGQT